MIDTIFFDADGVVQKPGDRFWSYATKASPDGDPITFLRLVGTHEKPCLTSNADFVNALERVLDSLGRKGETEEAIAAWHDVEVNLEILARVQRVRESGITCHLATNQNPMRAAYMRNELRMTEHFDHCYFSCEIGTAKPDEAYFRYLVANTSVPAGRALFIDDSGTNVEAARRAGLCAALFPAHGKVEDLESILRLHGLA